MVERLPSKQYVVGSTPMCTRAAIFSFSMEKEMFMLVVLPCFDICRANSFHVSMHVNVYVCIARVYICVFSVCISVCVCV